MNDCKLSRKLDFPDSIMEGFRQLEKLDYNRMSQEKIGSIVNELIFGDFDRRSGRKRHLTPLKELQMLEKIASYFWERKSEIQHIIFLWLFLPGKTLSPIRFSVLSKLVSMAIADSNGHLLNYVAMWMQMSGCHSEMPRLLADVVAKDHLDLVPSLGDHLKCLPAVSPLFCCGLLSCLTSSYRTVPPSSELLILALEWLGTSPAVCFAAVSSHTPLPGLVHWCTITPLLLQREKDYPSCQTQLLSQLHLRVLELLKAFGRGDHESCKVVVVSLDTLADLLSESWQRRSDVQVSLDRLAQILQVSLSSGCLQETPELLHLLSQLPHNRLLAIVRERWKLA